ncbi:Endonuclease/Exonuclease/phosphatase family protein [compost metagenome]
MKIHMTLIAALLPMLALSQNTRIYTIQGSGSASPLVSQTVTTEGVVYADFQGSGFLNGFFIQDTLGDGDPSTSDGILIYNPGGINVSVGDYVVVTGQVLEYFDLTEIGSVTNVTITGTVSTMITPVPVTLPVTSMAQLEALEGMYVTFPQNLVVTDNYSLGRYGEFTLATSRQFIPTNILDPNDNPASGTTTSGTSNVPAITAYADLNNRSRILVNDGRSTSWPNPVPYIDPVNRTLRNGSTVQQITGALSYGFSKYRLMPTSAPAFSYAPRPEVPTVGGDIKVVSFNILNFFSTIDNGSNDARGADSQAEYVRQRDKLIAALDSMDADIYALIEVENNDVAADSILNALNAAAGGPVYAKASESTFTGTYAIKNIFLYKTAIVTPLDTMMTSTDVLFYPPPIARQFEVTATGGKFNLIANHYRYKGCDGAVGADLDQLDGQSCYNATRRLQSLKMLEFFDQVETLTGNDQHLIVGDFNSYAQEDPMDVFAGAGYASLINDTVYSYAYMSEFGSLDHAFASPSLVSLVDDAKVWHINADESPALDYNLENVVDDLYENNPYRSSDHDPLIIGISPEAGSVGLKEQVKVTTIFPNPFKEQLMFKTSEAADIQLTDLSGRVLKTIPGVNGVYLLETSSLPQGVILVSTSVNGKTVSTQRVVKY